MFWTDDNDWDLIVTNADNQIWKAICHSENIPSLASGGYV